MSPSKEESMQSSNPVFTRSEEFNGRGRSGYANFEQPGYGTPVTHSGAGTGRMTIDSVVQRTGATLGVVVLVAAITWVTTGKLVAADGLIDTDVQSRLYALAVVGSLGGFALSMVNSFKRVVSPGLVLAYAAFEGLAIGAFSKAIGTAVGNGAVVGAVLGTIAAVAGTLTAYKVFDIQVTNKFRTWVIGMMFGFVAVTMLDFVLGLFHADLGFNGFGTLGVLMSIVGLGIGVLMLILDFDFVERGIAAGLPERESWRAAFGLTVTIVWIYVELLRLISIIRN
ncbi:MAG: Bax inhibitor-1/YccA family protein [Marmoricola sp.]